MAEISRITTFAVVFTILGFFVNSALGAFQGLGFGVILEITTRDG